MKTFIKAILKAISRMARAPLNLAGAVMGGGGVSYDVPETTDEIEEAIEMVVPDENDMRMKQLQNLAFRMRLYARQVLSEKPTIDINKEINRLFDKKSADNLISAISGLQTENLRKIAGSNNKAVLAFVEEMKTRALPSRPTAGRAKTPAEPAYKQDNAPAMRMC